MNKKAFMWGSIGITSTGLLCNSYFGHGDISLNPEIAQTIIYGVPISALVLSNLFSKNKSLLEKAVENPELSAGIVNLSLGIPTFFSNPEYGLQVLQGNLLTTGWTYYFLNALKPFNAPYFKSIINSFKLNKNLIKNLSNESALEALLLTQDVYKDPASIYYPLASLEFKKENPDFEKAIDYALKGLESVKKKPLLERLGRRGISKFLDVLKIDVKSDLHKAFVSLHHGNTKGFVKNLNKFVEGSPSIGSKSVRVFALEKTNNSQLASKETKQELANSWNSLLEEILSNPEIYERFQTIEGKPVYTINLYEFMKKMLVLKEGNLEELTDEYENLLKIREKNLEVVDPLKIVEFKGKFFLAQKYANGEQVSEVFEKTRDLTLVQKSIKLTSRLHGIFPKQEKNNSMERTIKKILKSQLPKSLAEKLAQELPLIYKHSSNQSVFDCDAHLDNFILSQEKLVILDKPSRGYIFPEEDIAKLVDRGNIYVSVEEKLNDVVKNYSKDLKFGLSVLSLTTSKAITYSIYELSRQRIDYSREFLKNAIANLTYLQERHEKEYSLRESNNLESIKKNLTELQNIVA